MRSGETTEGPDDRALVQRYLSGGDEDAFRVLYRRHAAVLYRFALRRMRDPDAAAAVVQETWLRAARRLRSFRWRSSLRSWLTGIALNCCRERHRADRRHPGLGEACEVTPSPVGPRRGDLRLDLRRAVEALPERAREVLLLYDVEGYTHAEVAAVLGIEVGTSKSQLSRARAALRASLETRERDHG